MRFRKLLAIGLGLILITSSTSMSANQITTPADSQAVAGASTLTSDDLPVGFTLIGETFLDITASDDLDGLVAHYVSVYVNLDSAQQIRSHVYLFETNDQAAAAMSSIVGEGATPADIAGTPAQITVGTYDSADGQTIGTADVTFVNGNAVAGVAVDKMDGGEADAQLAAELAQLQNARMSSIAAGSSPVDLNLPALVVPYSNQGDVLQAGYLTSSESEAMYGVDGSLLTEMQSSWVQTTALTVAEDTTPRVTVGISAFSSPEQANDVVENSDSIFEPMAEQERLADVTIENADASTAYRYTSRDASTGDLDSFRIVFSTNGVVTIVDIQGAADSDSAESIANFLAEGQLDCQSNGVCEALAIPLD